MHCSKFAGAAQHFLLLLQKKTLAKEKEPEGISISPQTPLNRPEKPLRFFWTFPAIAENPMRIRTAQFFIRRTFHRKYSNATAHKSVVPYQAARSQTYVRGPPSGMPDRNIGAYLNSEAESTRTVTKRPFLPYLFPRKGKDRAAGGASETTTTERILASKASYPLCSFLPFQTAN